MSKKLLGIAVVSAALVSATLVFADGAPDGAAAAVRLGAALHQPFPMSVDSDYARPRDAATGWRSAALGDPKSRYDDASKETRKMTFSDLVTMAEAGKVGRVTVPDDDQTVKAELKDGGVAYVLTPPKTYGWLVDLAKTGVEVRMEHGKVTHQTYLDWASSQVEELLAGLSTVVASLIPVAMLVIFFFMLRMFNKEGGGVGRVIKPGAPGAVKFDDIAGAEDGKEVLADVVDYLKDPEKYLAVGARQRKGVLLIGPPGTGKTLLARAIAEEAGVYFMAVSGSEFQEMFAGLGGHRVRKIFKVLRKNSPCILFIDEIESIGRKRSQGSSAVENDSANTLNELLTQMDGIAKSSGIVVIGATNLAGVLDDALLRPGRFDLHVTVPLPRLKAREAILNVSARKVKIGADVDFHVVARGTPGFSGADLASLVNEAAIRAVKRGAAEVGAQDIEEAKDSKLLGGESRKDYALDEADAATVRYHESGHALVAVLDAGCDPIHKGTVAPRGQALGFIATLPLQDRVLMRRSKLKSQLVHIMGGRAAEEVVFGEDLISSGAVADIREATKIARAMVVKYGMGRRIASREADLDGATRLSEKTLEEIDVEVEVLVTDALETAVEIVMANRAALEALADRFKEEETLDGDEIRRIVAAAGRNGAPSIELEAVSAQ